MHAADRLKREPRLPRHDAMQALQCAAGDRRGRFQHARKSGGVPVVEVTAADARARLDPAHVLLVVEPQQFLARSPPRRGERHLLVQVLLLRLLPEGALAVDRERMAVGEAVIAQRFPDK